MSNLIINRSNLILILSALLLLILVGAVVYTATQGTLVPDDLVCDEYHTPTHPETGEPFNSLDKYQTILIEETRFNQSQAQHFIETQHVETRTVNETQVVQIQEVCP